MAKDSTALARHYDKLTPSERFPLIVAAASRGDSAERERLVQSAPKVTFDLPAHYGAATAFESLANFHMLTVLDLAARYLEACARMVDRKRKKGENEFERWNEILSLGYEVAAHLAGWRSFCDGLKVDPFVMWRIWPGFETIQRAESLAVGAPEQKTPGVAFVAEGVARYRARLIVGDPEWEVDEETIQKCWPVTAKGIASALRTVWEEQRKKWE
jgi:hypothetical protein